MLITVLLLGIAPTAKAEVKFGWWVNVSTGQGRLAGYASNGMNFMHVNVATYYTPAQINAFLDEARALGIEASISLTRTEHISYPWTAAQVQSFVNALENNPAVWGWYLADEPDLADDPALCHTRLAADPGYYPAVKSADPAHPAWIVLCGGINRFGNSLLWNDVADIIAVDNYVSYGTAEFENSDSRQSYDIWKSGVDWANTYNKKPFIAVVQGFGAGHGLWDDMTLKEEMYNVMTAVVVGVQRILFWAEEWADTDTNSAYTFSMVGQVMRYLRDIRMEMGNGITSDPNITVSQNLVSQDKLIFRHGVNGISHVILAINIANRGSINGATLSNVQFTMPQGVRPTEVEVIGENRTLPVTNGVFTDTFNRFEVHAYRFMDGSDATAPAPPTGLRVR